MLVVLWELKGQPTSEELLLFSPKALVFPESLVLVSSKRAILWRWLTYTKRVKEYYTHTQNTSEG